jgi:hypothetical protein
MDRTTDTADGAVAEALGAARSRLEAERLARRAFHCAARRRRIVTAAGIDADELSEHARRILDWLAGWDEPTIDGVVELVSATRAVAEQVVPAETGRRAADRSSVDARDTKPGGGQL